MKKFMIFLLMAFLYLGTSQASNEITSLSNDVGKSLHHWVAPNADYAIMSSASTMRAAMPLAPIDSTIRVTIVGPISACPGEQVVLTAVVENNYLGMDTFKWRLNGDYIPVSSGLAPNQVRISIPDNSGSLDSLLHEIDVRVIKGCNQVFSPVHYIRVNTTNIILNDIAVCPNDTVGTIVANVFNNGTEMPYAYVWYKDGTVPVDTTYVPYATLAVGTYVVEAHFTHSACIVRSNEATISNEIALDPNHLSLSLNQGKVCIGGQVTAVLSGLKNNYGVPSINWLVNGFEFPAHDTAFTFSPAAIDGDPTVYYINAHVSYSNYTCSSFTAVDTVTAVDNSSVVIAGDPILCDNDTVRLLASVSNPVGVTTFQWRVDGVIDLTQTDSVFVKKLSHRDNPYAISVIVNMGTPCEVISDDYSVYVGNNSQVAISVSADTVCPGNDVTLTANVGDVTMDGLTYKWFKKFIGGADSVLIPEATGPVFTASVPIKTTFYVQVLQNHTHCVMFGQKDVSVYGEPNQVDSIALTATQTNVCEGAQVTFTLKDSANVANYGDGTGIYKWYVNGILLPDVTTKSYTFSPAAFDGDTTNYDVYVVADYQLTCIIRNVMSNHVVVTTHSNPSVDITGNPLICSSTDVILHANAHNTISTPTYVWKIDGVVDTAQTTSTFHKHLKNRTYPYAISVILDDSTACSVQSEIFHVSVDTNPSVHVTVDYDTVCRGQDVTVTAHLGNHNQPDLTYQWYVDGNPIPYATQRTFTYTISNPDTTVFRVKVDQIMSSCTATNKIKVYTVQNPKFDTVLVTNVMDDTSSYLNHWSLVVNGTPAYNVCEGATVNITAYMKDAAGNRFVNNDVTYNWKRNGIMIPGVHGASFVQQLEIEEDATKYVYTVEVADPSYPNCFAVPVSAQSDTVRVNPNPSVVIDAPRYVCYKDELTNNIQMTAWVDGRAYSEAIYLWYCDGMFVADPIQGLYGARLNCIRENRYGYDYMFNVHVLTGNGCSVWAEPVPVTVMAPPVVTITPYSDQVCEDGEISLVANLNDYNIAEFQPVYQWYTNDASAGGIIPGETSARLDVHADASADYIVSVNYNVQNSTEGYCRALDTIHVDVYNTPMIDTIIMDMTQVCEGSQVTVTAVIDPVNNGNPSLPYIYRWYRNGELLSATDAVLYDSPVTVDGNEQQFTYGVAVYQYPGSMNCISPIYTSSETLTVYPNPIAVISGDQHICYTDTITLVANIDTISNPVGGLHYYWYESGAPVVNLNGDSKELKYYGVQRDEPYRFVVQIERENSEYGCRSYSHEYLVHVYDIPQVSLTASDTIVCADAQVTLTSHIFNTELEPIHYNWYVKEVSASDWTPIFGATEAAIDVTVNTTSSYKVVATHSLTECYTSDTIIVKAYEHPLITAIDLSDVNVCEGSDVTVVASIDSTKGIVGLPYYFEWRRNGELLPGNTATIHDVVMTADGTTQSYEYTAVAYQTPEILSCVSAPFTSSTLTVFANPRVVVTGDQHVCVGTDNIILTANVDDFTAPVGALHFYWMESGEEIVNLNGDSNILRYQAAPRDEAYRFTVRIERDDEATGCRSYSYEYNVFVYDNPVVNIQVVDEVICEGAEATLTAHLNDLEQTDLVYQWYSRNHGTSTWNLVPGATELVYTTIVPTSTDYQFVITHTLSGCSDTDAVTIETRPIPVISYVSMSDTNVCEGSDVEIHAEIDPAFGIAGAPYYFEWRRNGELLPGNTATIHDTPVLANATEHSFVYTAIAYQTPERLACVSEMKYSAALNVFNNPRVSISGEQHVCVGDNNITLTANVDTLSYTVGPLHYIWYESGNMIANSDVRVLTVTGIPQDHPYRFSVQVERDNAETSCRSYSDVYEVNVYEIPDVNITSADVLVCPGAEVTLNGHLDLNVPEQTNLQYQWSYTQTAGGVFTPIAGATALDYTTTINQSTLFKLVVTHTLSNCTNENYRTISVAPKPVVSQVAMSDTNICEGSQVTITASVVDTCGVPNAPYFYEWRRNGELLPANTASIEDSPVTVDGNEQSFVYSVIAYQTPERLACYSLLNESAQLNVYPNPVVAISGDQHVCETDSIFLVANVDTVGRPVGLLHYTWYESGRLRDNMAYAYGDSRYFGEYFYPQTEPYRFTVEVQRDNIAAGCRSYSEEFLVWVYNEPVVNITADQTDICENGQVTLTANLNDYDFDYANNSLYQWYTVVNEPRTIHIGYDSLGRYIDSVIIEEVVTPIPGATMLTYTTPLLDTTATYAFTVVHSASGCNDYDDITINVHSIPEVTSIELISDQDTICPGGRVELKANVSGGVSGGETYTWYRNGQVIESNSEVLVDYPVSENGTLTHYTYEVTVSQSASGCESVITDNSKFNVWVSPVPTVVLSGDPIVCDTTNPNIVITANIVSAVDPQSIGGLTYQWFENNAPLAGENGTVLSVHRPYRDYPYSFNFEVTNQYGCNISSEPFLVYVNDNPIVNIAADDENICVNGTVTLTATLYDQNSSNMTYKWFKKTLTDADFVEIVGANNATYTTSLSSTTTFRFYAYQIDSHCAANSNELTINVNPAPEITTIAVASQDFAICEGHIVSLIANVSGGQPTDEMTFTWYKDNEIVPGAVSANFTDYPMSVDGDLTVHTYNATVAQTSSSCYSLLDASDMISITVRPNPSFTIFGDQVVCQPEGTLPNITLYARTSDNLIGSTTDYTYTWYAEGVVVPGQTTSTFESVYPARDYAYNFKLVVTDNAYQCSTETSEYPVIVNEKPVVNLTATEDYICTLGEVTLTAHLLDQTENDVTYQWEMKSAADADFVQIPGANELNYTTVLTETTDFRVVVFEVNSECVSTSQAMTINVVYPPVISSIDLISESNDICDGNIVSLKANYTGGVSEDDVTFTWYKNGQVIENANVDFFVDYPLAVDDEQTAYMYNVTVAQTSSACHSTLDLNNTVTINVMPNPYVVINGLEYVCEPLAGEANIALQAVVSPVPASATDYTYTWFENDTVLPGENGLTLNINRPARAQDYKFNFVVTNAQTSCTGYSQYFYVHVEDRPEVVASVDQSNICENGTATLTASLYDQNINTLAYQWQVNRGGNWINIPGANDLVYVTNELSSTTDYQLVVTDLLTGCQSTSNVVTVVVLSTPVITITDVTTNEICNGGQVVMTATNPTAFSVMGDVNYQWYQNGVAIEGANQYYYSTQDLSINGNTTSYEFSVKAFMSHSACITNMASTTVTVYPDPNVEISYSNGLTLCSLSGSTTLTANASHPHFTNFAYQWYLNGMPIPGATNRDFVVTNLNESSDVYNFSVSVKVPNPVDGCVTFSEPVSVTVVPQPVVTISVEEDVNSICEGGTVTFVTTVEGGVADAINPYTYEWHNNLVPDQVIGTEATYTTSANDEPNAYTYWVNVQSGYGCVKTATYSGFVVASDPEVAISVVPGADAAVCNGGQTQLMATVSGGIGEVSYQWYKNGLPIAGATGQTIVTDPLYANNPAAYTVSVSQTGIACTATSTQFNVPVYPNIDVVLSANSTINCVGGTVTLTAQANNAIPNDVLDYQWYRIYNGVSTPINGANNYQYETAENMIPGIYEYSVQVSSQVSGCQVALSSSISITVESEPTVSIYSSDADNSICAGGELTLFANVTYPNNATQHNNSYVYTWKWYQAGVLMSEQTTAPQFTIPATLAVGTYNFFVDIASNDGLGCDATSQAVPFTVLVKPVPSISLIANANESCEGGVLNVMAQVVPTNLTGAYTWTVNGQVNPSIQNNISISDLNLGDNTITAYFTPDNSQNACQSEVVSINHTVVPIPVVSVVADDPTHTNMCAGGTISLTASANGNSNYSYEWVIGGQVLEGFHGNQLTRTLDNAGSYTFQARVQSSLGCNSSLSTPVVVSVAEQPNLAISQLTGYAEMCAGGEITLMANVPNYASINNGVTNNTIHGSYTYVWKRDGNDFEINYGITTDRKQIVETLDIPASYNYSVTVYATGFNCQPATATLDHLVTVVPDPSWSVNQVAPTELCLGGIVNLNAEVTGGVQNQQAGRIQWTKTFNGITSNVNGLGGQINDVPAEAGIYTYTPTYIDYIGAGCNIADATSTMVTVNELPSAQFVSGSGSVLCSTDYLQFATLNIALTGTAPYTFVIKNVTTGESQTIVTSLNVYPYNVHPSTTSVYRLESVTDANGCVGSVNGVADAVVYVSDVAVVSDHVIADCESWIARIYVNVQSSLTSAYTVTLPDGTQQTGTLQFDPSAQLHYASVQMQPVAGDFSVLLTIEGCSHEVIVTVPANHASMALTEDIVDQRWDDVVVVNNNPANNGGYVFHSYQWYRNGVMIPGATGQYYQEVGGLNGFYSVELDGVNNLGQHVHFVTCEIYFSANSDIRVYPVPATTNQEVYIELDLTEDQFDGAVLDIFDAKGALVMSMNNLTPITKVSGFGAQGSYFGRIITGTNEIKTVKFIIVK